MGQAERMNVAGVLPLTAHEVLRAMGLSPWGAGAIEIYMALERAKAPRANIWYYVDKVFQARYVEQIGLTALGVAVVSFLCAVALVFFATTWTPFFWAVGIFLPAALLTAGACTLDSAMRDQKFAHLKTRDPARWVESHLEDFYGEATPKAKIQVIVDVVRGLFPGTSFKVHDLVQNSRSLDPVLFAVLPDGERIALLVWDAAGVIRPPPA